MLLLTHFIINNYEKLDRALFIMPEALCSPQSAIVHRKPHSSEKVVEVKCSPQFGKTGQAEILLQVT